MIALQGADGLPGTDGLDGRDGQPGPSGAPVSLQYMNMSYTANCFSTTLMSIRTVSSVCVSVCVSGQRWNRVRSFDPWPDPTRPKLLTRRAAGSGPDPVTRFHLCVCLRVSTITFDIGDFLPRYSARRFILALSRSLSRVKVICQSSLCHEENDAEWSVRHWLKTF